eukprot:6295638-Amphidinium_carterae.1
MSIALETTVWASLLFDGNSDAALERAPAPHHQHWRQSTLEPFGKPHKKAPKSSTSKAPD